MIKLNLKSYCHKCPYFSTDSYTMYVNGDPMTIVQCEHKVSCENIEDYIRKEIKEEKKNEQSDSNPC